MSCILLLLGDIAASDSIRRGSENRHFSTNQQWISAAFVSASVQCTASSSHSALVHHHRTVSHLCIRQCHTQMKKDHLKIDHLLARTLDDEWPHHQLTDDFFSCCFYSVARISPTEQPKSASKLGSCALWCAVVALAIGTFVLTKNSSWSPLCF